MLAQFFHGLGQDLPLGLFHHAPLERLGRVPRQDIHGLLLQDGASVRHRVHDVHRRTRHLHPRGQRRLVDLQPVEALATERRDEGWVHVHHAPPVVPHEVRAQDVHEPRQDNDLRPLLLQQFKDLSLKLRRVRAVPKRHHVRPDAGLSGPLQRIGVASARDDLNDFSALDDSALLRVQQRLKVRPPAGHQHGNTRAQHIETPSPWTISPMT